MDVIDHKIVFTFFGILPIRDTVLYTWITMGIIIAVVLILKVLRPNLLEYILEMVISILDDAMDVDNLHPYIPLLGSLMIFTLFANLISIIPGMKSPTADINTTIGLALIVVLSVHIYGMIKKGVWKYLKDFASPIFMLPVELIGQLSRTLSLSMRLFGNILSGGSDRGDCFFHRAVLFADCANRDHDGFWRAASIRANHACSAVHLIRG